MALTLVTPPTVEPLTLSDLRAHLRIADNFEDATLNRLIRVVRSRCERATRRRLITQSWLLKLDQWPVWDGYHGARTFEPYATLLPAGGYVEIPHAPLQSIDSVRYVDLAGNTQTWDPSNYLTDYPVGDYCRRGRLSLGWVKVWPIIRPVMNAIQIAFTCGYGATAEAVPDLLVQAMLLDAGTLFDVRAAVLSGTRAAAIEIPGTTKDIYKAFRSL